MTKNRVFINQDDLIEIVVDGDQTVTSVQAMGDKALALAKEVRLVGKPALVLDNLLAIGTVPVEARKLVMELVKSSEYDKLAMLGSGAALKLGANLILQATGRSAHVKYFDSYDKAHAWLKRP